MPNRNREEFAGFLKTGYRSVRFSSVLCFTSATVVGVVLTGSLIDFRIVWLLIFSMFSTGFGFVINDLSDADLDRSAGVLRNPFSTEELSRRRGIMLAVFLLLVSVMPLSFLNPGNRLLGLVVIFLCFTYSWIVRAKARPVLDIAYHGSFIAILATMGYMEYSPFDVTCLLLALIVFLLSSVSQVLQEVRDYETDRKIVRTTAVLLGRKKSLILSLAFFTSAFAIFLLLSFYGAIPTAILFPSPLVYFYIAPIIQSISNEEHTDVMLKKIKKRRLIVIATLIGALILARI